MKKWDKFPFFHSYLPGFLSKKLQLLNGLGGFYRVMTAENLHHPELLVGYAHYSDMAFGWKEPFDPLYMHVGVFPAAAMTQVNAELEHLESISQNILPEFSIDLPVFFGICWKIKEY